MEHRVLEIGAQKLTHRHDVMIETYHEISKGVSGAVKSTLRSVVTLISNTCMQIAHLGEETLRVAMEAVCRAQAGKLIG